MKAQRVKILLPRLRTCVQDLQDPQSRRGLITESCLHLLICGTYKCRNIFKKLKKMFRFKDKKIPVQYANFLLLNNLEQTIGYSIFLFCKASAILPGKAGQEQLRRGHPVSTPISTSGCRVPNAKTGKCTVVMGVIEVT